MRFYENPEKTSENRLPNRAYYIPEGEARYRLLNGEWNFAYFADGDDAPEKITAWDKVAVPSCWQNTGYENPNYSNVNYPYPCDPPYVPDVNPLGVYERRFNLSTAGKRNYLVLEGVSSCAEVYLNGKRVGFTQGSHLQAEFDLTPYAKEGMNTLRIKVWKWCVGSYLEDQDQFRCNGIFRDVYLLERPEGHLRDLRLTVRDEKTLTVKCDRDANVVLSDHGKKIAEKNGKNVTFTVANAHLWNAEDPYLYDVTVTCAGEIIRRRVGFRTVSISDKSEILINGVAVKFRGVNHHDTSPEHGWVMTDDEIKRDLRVMKELNINTIRTSHYPPSPRFLDYCDEMGFYVVLETDIETHGMLRRYPNVPYRYDCEDPIWPCVDKRFKNEYVERMERAIRRDENHPSIFMWSLGNESGFGPNQVAMNAWARKYDPTRLTHYEGASDCGDKTTMSVYSRMYPQVGAVEEWCKDPSMKQPIFLCEFSHAMGNGPGDVWQYVEKMYRYPKYTGGCIWEFCDHTVWQNGVGKYGGDFPGERTHEGNFCCDGLVFADRSLKSGSYEARAAYAPFRFTVDGETVTLTNHYDFIDLSERKIRYAVRIDGETVEEKTLVLAVPPHGDAKFTISTHLPKTCALGAYLDVSLLDAKGKEIGTLQSELDVKVVCKRKNAEPAKLTEDDRYVYTKGENFSYRFSKRFGAFDSMIVGGEEQIASPSEIDAFRACTDNDRNVRQYWAFLDIWQGENMDFSSVKIYECEVKENRVTVTGSCAGVSRLPYFRFRLTLTFYADGRVDHDLRGDVRKDAFFLPRLGFTFHLPSTSSAFSYYGRGPLDNYRDLCHHATVDRYESDADREYVPYIFPQEHGNHTDVRELTIGNLRFVGDPTFEMNVSRYRALQLYHAKHTDEIGASDGVHVRIDYKVSGIGSNSCGPQLPEAFRLNEKKIAFRFSILPA